MLGVKRNENYSLPYTDHDFVFAQLLTLMTKTEKHFTSTNVPSEKSLPQKKESNDVLSLRSQA